MLMTYEQTLYTPYMLESDDGIRNGDIFPYWPQNATRIELYGEQGVMYVGRMGGGWQVYVRPKNRQPVVKDQMHGRFPDPAHKENFVQSVKSRKRPNADIEEGHRSLLLVHYANISCRLGGRKLRIDPKTEQILDDPEAMELFKRDVSQAVGGGREGVVSWHSQHDPTTAAASMPSRCAPSRSPASVRPRCWWRRRVPIPVPGPGEVLVRVSASGVNRPDVMQRKGDYPPPPGASDLPGLEVAGTLVAGDAAELAAAGLTLGDPVCALVAGGGYAEFCAVPLGQCLPVPPGLSMIEAAALPETFFTVWSNVFNRAGLKPGETLLVHGGSSGIGVTAIQLGKAFGATVLVTAGSEEKCAACRALGADHAINYRTQRFCRRGDAVHRRTRRRRDPRHGGGRLRRPRDRLPGRRRPHRHHRGVGRREGRVRRRPGVVPPPDDHRLDVATAPRGVQGGDRRRVARAGLAVDRRRAHPPGHRGRCSRRPRPRRRMP